MRSFITMVGLAALPKRDHMDDEQDGQQDVLTAQGIYKLAGWLVMLPLAFVAVLWLPVLWLH
jgi:hypothetical protein